MEFLCWFFSQKNSYACLVFEANITEKDHEIKRIKGIHKEGKSDKDVELVWFVNTKVNYFPRGLQNHFPNLNHLTIYSSGIKEISKNDFKGLEELVTLQIENSQLTSLPDDLFTEMANLEIVSFLENQIELTSSELLKPLLGREDVEVDLRDNKNIDACYWPRKFGSLGSLEELIKLIDEKCIKPAPRIVPDPVKLNPKLKKMWLSGKFSDLTIIAGEKEFKVHKAVLGIESEVFSQILEEESEATELKIPDFSTNSVEALLKFIYTNEASEDGDAKENFEIANKFKVDAMKSFYEKIICDQLDESNAFETFMFAHRLSSQLLKEKSFQQIAEKIPELPDELMEDPEDLKKLIDARQVFEEILLKYKN